MTRRIAALDLGTNTFHLIIADVSDIKIKEIVLAEQIHVKLGEGGINKGEIAPAAFQRGLEALSVFKNHISKSQADCIVAVGTAALRTAANGTEFITQIKNTTGISVDIIEGDREAELIYQGVQQSVDLAEPSVIMDIGGGSVEFIFCGSDGIHLKKSYPIGAAKLMDMFHHSDPISDNDITAIQVYLELILSELKSVANKYCPKVLIGSAGAFETFAALYQIKYNGIPSEITRSFSFNKPDLDSVLSDIIKSTHPERANNAAILSVRTDMIVVASVLTRQVIKLLKVSSVIMSTYALKEGLLIEAANNQKAM